MTLTETRQDAAASLAGPTRSQNAYEQLRSEILLGKLEPGTKLKIDVLQRSYALSNTPLREALNRLSAEKLVVADGRRGFRVSPISADDFQDLTNFRLMVELEAMAQSIRKGGDNWEADVLASAHRLDLLEGVRGAERNARPDAWTERHKAFHGALVAGCGSPRLLASWSEMFDQAERYRRLSGRLRTKPRDARIEHRRLAKLAVARNTEVIELLREHIMRTAQHVMDILEGRGD